MSVPQTVIDAWHQSLDAYMADWETGLRRHLVNPGKNWEVKKVFLGPLTKYSLGFTQIDIDPDSMMGQAIRGIQNQINDNHLTGDGKKSRLHITLRYGIRVGTDVSRLAEFLSQQKPFFVTLGKTDVFPPSESSNNASVVILKVSSPELMALNHAVGEYANFAPPTFDYTPHVTLAYVYREFADRYRGNTDLEGLWLPVNAVAICSATGAPTTVTFTKLFDPNQPRDPDGRFAGGSLEEESTTAVHQAATVSQQAYTDQVKKDFNRVRDTQIKASGDLDAHESQILEDYTTKNNHAVNEILRGRTKPKANLLEDANSLQKAIDRNPLPEDMVLFRGSHFTRSYADQNFKPGMIFTDKGFVSASMNLNTAGLFMARTTGLKPSGVLFRIEAPKGTPGMLVRGDNYESEVLLSRGSRFQISSAENVKFEDRDYKVVCMKYAGTESQPLNKLFDPNQPRDPDGRFASEDGLTSTLEDSQTGVGFSLASRNYDYEVKTGDQYQDALKDQEPRIKTAKLDSDQWLLSPDRDAIETYSGSGYRRMNASLRDEASLKDYWSDSVIAETKEKVAVLQKVILKTKLEKDLTVFRGGTFKNFRLDGFQPGRIVNETGFTSTSTNLQYAGGFIGFRDRENRANVLYRIEIPKGNPALYSYNRGEDEVVLPHGSKFEVLKVHDVTVKSELSSQGLPIIKQVKVIYLRALPYSKLKKLGEIRTLTKTSPKIIVAQARLTATLKSFFKDQAIQIAKRLREHGEVNKLLKADPPPPSELDKLLEIIWAILAKDIEPDLVNIAQESSSHSLAQLNMTGKDMIDSANTVAGKWASQRAAEMVGMRRQPDGNLIENPNPKWSIAQTTRDEIRKILVDGFSKDTPIGDIADKIQGAGAFSDHRAEMIARTETALAQGQGNLVGWRESGVVFGVNWDLSHDHDPALNCNCAFNEDSSPFEIDDIPDFPDHPNCNCALTAVLAPFTKFRKEFHEDEPRDASGEWTSDGSGESSQTFHGDALVTAYQFYSPNVEENLNYKTAVSRLDSDDQKRFTLIGKDIDRQIGLDAHPVNAVGDWSDGAENTVFNVIHEAKNYEDVRYSAALKGSIADQKAVIPFMVDPNGKDILYRFALKGNPQTVRETLDKEGVQFRTLIPGKSQTEVVVFDPGGSLRDTIEKIGNQHGIKVTQSHGTGEFLGGDTRTEGQRAYRSVIKDYEVLHPDRRYTRPGVPNLVRSYTPQELIKFYKLFDPNEPRDETGKWTSDGGGGLTTTREDAQAGADHATSGLNPDYRSNVKTLYSKAQKQQSKTELSTPESAALEKYTDTGYSEMNGVLRGDIQQSRQYGSMEEVQKQSDTIQKAINKNSFPQDITLFRGGKFANDVATAYKPGAVITEKGFTSTSMNLQTAGVFMYSGERSTSNETQVLFRIELPKGNHGLAFNSGEAEVLLPKNSRFQVLQVHDVFKSNPDKEGMVPQKAIKVVYLRHLGTDEKLTKIFDVNQPRDDKGKWASEDITSTVKDSKEGAEYAWKYADDYSPATAQYRNKIQSLHLDLTDRQGVIMNGSERESLNTYVDFGFREINTALRGKAPENMPSPGTHFTHSSSRDKESVADDIKNIQQVTSRAEIRKEMTLFRGGLINKAILDAYKPGKIITDKAFTSATMDLTIAGGFLHIHHDYPDQQHVLYRIDVPEKSHGLFMNTHEAEVLFPHDAKFQISKIHEVKIPQSKFPVKVAYMQLLK